MKRFFKTMAFTLLGLVLSMNLMAAGEKTYTHAFSTKPTASDDNTLSSVEWTFGPGTNLGDYNSANYAGVQLGTKSATGSITMTTKNNWGEENNDYKGYTKIKEIHVWLNNGSGNISATVKIGGVAATASGTVVKNSSAKSYKDASKITYTPASNSNTGKIEIAYSTSSKAGYFCAIEVVCEKPAAPAEPFSVTLKRYGQADDVISNLTSAYTLPAAKDELPACDGWEFKGWSKDEVTSTTETPTFVTEATATGTYYAVYGKTDGGGTQETDVIDNAATSSSCGTTGTTAWVTNFDITKNATYTIHTMGINTGMALRWNSNGWLETKTDCGDNIVSVTVCGTSGKSVDINAKNSGDGSYTFIKNLGLQGTDNNATYEFTSTQNYKIIQIKGKDTSTDIKSITIVYGSAPTTTYTTSPDCVAPTYSVTILSNDVAMGSVTVEPEITEDAYEAGTEFYVEATAEEGYRFVNWIISDDNEGASLSEEATEAVNIFTTGAANVTLTANFEEIPANPITVTLEVGEHGTLDCDDCQGNQLTEETAGEGVLVPNVTANEGWAFLGWSTSSTATEPEYEVADIFYPSDDNKTLYAVYAQLYKVTLKYTDEVLTQETAGGSVTLPARNCKNETYKDHFAGWSITEFAEETINPATAPTIIPVGEYTPTEDIILYPVFSVTAETTQWTKKTCAEVAEGVYALITTDGHAFNGAISDGHGQITENAFVFDANDIATSVPTGICEITMQPYKNAQGEVLGYKMYNADNGYLYASAASSGKLAWHKSEDADWCVYNSNWEYYKNYSGKYAVLRSYDNSSFRTYSSNNGDVLQFAKKESASVGKYWSKPANDVVNPELDLAAGDYLAPQTVKITDATYQESGYTYYYTTNGNDPDKTSAEYDHENGIKLETADNYTVKVIGYDEDGYTSQIASATYVLYPVFSSISDMYTSATENKPVGLELTDAYVHAINTIGGNSQIFVQQGDLGVVLSVTTENIPEGIAAGKQISGTAVGSYTITNARPQISKFEFQSTFTVADGSRPEPITITETTAAKVSTNLLGLVKLEGVYAQSDASKIIVVNSNAEGTGTSMNVYDFFNKVSTIPASDIKCNVIGLFNERQNNNDPIVYSIMPVLDTDFDVVEKQNAQLPTVSPVGGATEGEALPVANEEIITITPVAGFTTSYKINDAAEWTPITTQKVQPTITEENTKIEVKATRPYYNDASVTYYYQIDPSLTKYQITLPSPQTYVKTETDLASAKAGDKVTITISQKVERYWETSVTVVKTDEESVPTDVTSEGEHVYSFTMPAYPVTVKVTAQDAPKSVIYYNKGGTGIEGEMSQESVYIGDEYTLKDCDFHGTGLTFIGWKAYKTGDESTPVTITDNKIIVPDYNVSVKATWDEAAWHKDGTWELVTKTSELGVGDYVIFTDTQEPGDDVTRYAGTSTIKGEGKNLQVTSNISISGNKLTRTNNDATMIFQIETGNETNTYAFYADGIGYLNANGTGNNNYMITTESKASTNASWTIESIAATNGEAVVKAKSENRNQMQVNVSNRIFAAYNSKQGGLAIYKFYPKSWTVTFDDNVEDEEIAVPEMQRADPTTNKVTISTDVPVREGYTFLKWNSAKGGAGVISADPGDEITLSQNTTLYAQWNIKQYNVAVAEVENVTIQAKPYSEEAIAEGANADVNFKKSVVLTYSDLNEDYVFKSWKVTKAGDESVIVPLSVGSSTTFEVPAYAVKVSAVIESKATTQLTVTYHANGGKNKTAGEPEEVSEQVNWNATIKFAEHPCPFEKNLCTFIGWNTKADGTGTTYKTQVTVKTDIDLYAMWEASAVEYVIDNNVEAKVKVQEGVAPTGSAATFVTTYTGTFGQLTDTHKGTLTLTGYAGKVITGVKMQMKSNASSGAGTIVIKVGDKEICSTSYAESFGSHSNSYSVAELQNFNAAIIGETENITIVVSCTDNSLYIKGYTIEYTDPEIIRNELAVDQYTTFCWTKTIPANAYTGATFWNIESKTTMADGRLSSITIVQHEGDLEAGVPYIMYNTATEYKCYQTGEAVDAPAAEGNNGLVGVFETTMFDNFSGDVATIDALAAARGIYIISDGTLYLCGNNCGVYANRAYILNSAIEDKSETTPVSAPRRTIGTPRGTATGLFNNVLRGSDDVMKVIRNNQLYIIKNGRTYNAQGAWLK